MYYALIIISVIMFGVCFACNDIYQKVRGNTVKVSVQFSLLSSFAGLVVLLIVNKFKFEYTHYTLFMAFIQYLISIGFTFCSFKSLGVINLSLYSLFSMLGGMVLPFLQGILFYGEQMTVAKAICLVFIIVALLLTVERGEKSKGYIYYAGIFVLNGMTGVIAKLFVESKYPKTSSAGFSILSCLVNVIISLVILAVFFRHKQTPKETAKSLCSALFNGATNRIANYVLLIALMHVEASVQYPMVTGGVMIVSTVISYFGKNKPTVKEIISVGLAFIGMLALFAIPI
ncbi:MAG: hypothetical protein E7537_04070 [Ruminococcaceae bacterium]|nr:hypothetical protein [Oscillospiraceae bacterium]